MNNTKRICSLCGHEILDKHLNKDPLKRKYELKWNIHYACKEKLLKLESINNDPTTNK